MSRARWDIYPHQKYYCERCYDPAEIKDLAEGGFNASCISIFDSKRQVAHLYLCPKCIIELALTLLDLADGHKPG